MKKKEIKKKVLVSLLIIILCLIICPYIFVEINTALYKDKVKDLYTQSWEIHSDALHGDTYCKVFYKKKEKAKVFYANNTGAFFCYFNVSKDSYKLYETEVLWSKFQNGGEQFYYPFYPIKDMRNYFVSATEPDIYDDDYYFG